MDESFYNSESVPGDTIRTLMQRSDSPAFQQFILMYTLAGVTGAWVVLAWGSSWWNIVLSQAGFAIMVCSTFACLHETAHGTAFKSRPMNRIAAFLAGLAHLYPSSLFREFHFMHHRHTHIPGLDPEISVGNRPGPSFISSLPIYLVWLSGFPLLLFKLGMLVSGCLGMPEGVRTSLYPFVRTSMRRTIAIESFVVLTFHLGLLALAVFVDSGFWGIMVGQLAGHCLLAAYLTPEHNGLPHEGNILEKTRSMKTNRLIRFLMWNMPYHAEHHAFPAVPFHALPKLSERIHRELKHSDLGYLKFHAHVLTHFGD